MAGAKSYPAIRVVKPAAADEGLAAIAGVFAERVHGRSKVAVSVVDAVSTQAPEGTFLVVCKRDASIPADGFRLESAAGGVTVSSGGNRGFLYAFGKMLRMAQFDTNGFVPGAWRGTSVPEKPLRAIYFATHFHNYYHEAPLGEVERYVQDLGLWGYNTVVVWFDMHHYSGINDPAAQAMLTRLKGILHAAKAVGLDAGLGVISNEGYGNSPGALRALNPNRAKADFYGCEICPGKAAGLELILKTSAERFEALRETGIDFLWLWPYDQGGCACEHCRPWGCNGHVKASKAVAVQARGYFPKAKIALSTWLFDEAEWKGLATAFAQKPEWVDYVIADSHGSFPRFPLDHGAPGGLPLLSFPEISMWMGAPWGGSGANPGPARFQGIWNSVQDRISGGAPYSEGIFEDINKAIFAQFYWDARKPALDTVREYVASEYSPEVVEGVTRAIQMLEAGHAESQKAFDLLVEAEKKMPESARVGWRWRILRIRALLQKEKGGNPNARSEEYKQAIQELVRLYHAEQAHPWVTPKL